jgi:predicted aldo/keto reductase-like oxidoreductase
VILSTKHPVRNQEDADQWRDNLETQLRRLDTDYVDIYNCHNLKWEEFQQFLAVPGGVLEKARKAQAEGLIRHLSLSCHDTPDNMLRLIDTGEFASMTLQYNLLDRTNQDVITHAHERGMGIVVMGPVGGGRLGMDSPTIRGFLPEGREVRSTPELAIRFVLTHPGVTVALSGMNALQQVEENVVTASRAEPLSAAEMMGIAAALDETKRLADLYCTGCGYCLPCPHEVKIPDNFRLMNYHRLYGLTDWARREYAKLTQNGGAAALCEECHECEPKCPQNIRIPDQLMEVAGTLG